jgi:hypothetical protein
MHIMNGMQASFRFRHSLGNGPIGIVPLPSLRWEMNIINISQNLLQVIFSIPNI